MNEVVPRQYIIEPKIEWVKVSPETDGVDGLYIDEELVVQGDYYHDKISEYIAGFLAGLKHGGSWSGQYTIWELNFEHELATDITELGEKLPDKLYDLPLDDMTSTTHTLGETPE